MKQTDKSHDSYYEIGCKNNYASVTDNKAKHRKNKISSLDNFDTFSKIKD